MKVREIMVAPVVVVKEETSLEDIARTMLEHGIGGVPVVDARGKLSGIVTESDFAAKERGIPFSLVRAPQLFGNWLGPSGLEHVYRAARSMTAREIMQSCVITVTEDDSLERVLQFMMRHDINRVPVVRDGVPVGIVTRHDLLRLMLANHTNPKSD
jgi:CBS domain-containing protein